MSEELENSLQQVIESYLSERLHAIEAQLSALQDEFNAAFVRLRESSASGSLEDASLSAAIAAHLQAARSEKLSGTAMPTHASESTQVANIRRAVGEIAQQQSQVNVLSALLGNAAGFTERVAIFVVKHEQAVGWRVCEANDPNNLEAIPSIALPLTADTVVSSATRSQTASMSAPGTHSDDNLITDQLGGEPQNATAIPLIVRGRVVAVLYADSTSSEPDAINLEALETLTRVAGMAVDLISAHGAQPAQLQKEEAQPTLREAQVEEAPAVPAPVEDAAPESTYTPQIEPHASEVFVEPVVEEISGESAPEPGAAEMTMEAATEVAPEEVSAEQVTEADVENVAEPEPVSAPSTFEAAPEPPQPAASPAPSFTSQYAAPLGSSRRYGVAEPELPIGVGEEERRLHNDARRFARLLVSEIKLYNEPKVKEGRSKSDIYDRLRDDIERSRQMYEKRVAPPVAARHDYFHQELVNTLAEGDPAKLGASYPGATAPVS